MVEERIEVTVEKKRRNPFAAILFVIVALIILIGVPIYLLTYEPIAEQIGDQPLEAVDYAQNVTVTPPNLSQDLIQADTEILGSAVYGLNNVIIGTMYDAYVDRNTGSVRWISILEDNDLNENIRLIPATNVMKLNANEPVMVGLTLDGFIDLPLQTVTDENLAGLISIRHLPGSSIIDPNNGEIGRISSLTYDAGKIDRIYFAVGNEGKEFYVPFQHLDYSSLANTAYHDYNIELTERQAGAIQMYFQNSGQF